MSLILRLSNGEKIEMKASLKEFEEMYLQDDGRFHSGYIRFVLNEGKEEQSELIFTNHIVSIEEVKWYSKSYPNGCGFLWCTQTLKGGEHMTIDDLSIMIREIN